MKFKKTITRGSRSTTFEAVLDEDTGSLKIVSPLGSTHWGGDTLQPTTEWMEKQTEQLLGIWDQRDAKLNTNKGLLTGLGFEEVQEEA